MARLPEDAAAALVDHVRRLAIALGARMTNPNDAFPLGQTGYMKVWSLRRQRIHADFLAVDETQDSNSALVHVLGSADDADRVLRRQQPAAVCVARGAIDAIGSPSRPAHDLVSRYFSFWARARAGHEEQLLAMLASRTADKPETATVILSTVHRSKGLEFERVHISEDFSSPDARRRKA